MADHWRTSRAAPGGMRQLPGSPHDGKHYAPSANLILFPSGTPFERREISKPSLNELETDAKLLFFGLLLGPWIIVLGLVFIYQAFVS